MTDLAQTGQRISTVSFENRIDFSSIFGILFALITTVVAVTLGGSSDFFFNVPSVFIVLGGTVGILIASVTFKELRGAARSFGYVFRRSFTSNTNNARQLIELSQVARANGLLALQNYYDAFQNQPLLFRGLTMVVDGASEEEIRTVLDLEITNGNDSRATSIEILNRGADVAPAMGLMGTLIGLIQMLAQLDDPSQIGPSMAVALVTTFYGVILSNMLFLPAGSKLEGYSKYLSLIERMHLLAVFSIFRKENPRRLETQLNALLPVAEQLRMFD